MPYKVEITLADGTGKVFTIGSDVDLPTGMKLTTAQLAMLMSNVESLTSLMSMEEWKKVELSKQ